MRRGNWKLIAYRSGKAELFNLAEDVSEKHNLAAGRPDKVKEMKKIIFDWEKTLGVDMISGCKPIRNTAVE